MNQDDTDIKSENILSRSFHAVCLSLFYLIRRLRTAKGIFRGDLLWRKIMTLISPCEHTTQFAFGARRCGPNHFLGNVQPVQDGITTSVVLRIGIELSWVRFGMVFDFLHDVLR
jgi:hypothetical protein